METLTAILAFAKEHYIIAAIIVFYFLGVLFGADEDEEKDCFSEYMDGYITGIPNDSLCSWFGAIDEWNEEDHT